MNDRRAWASPLLLLAALAACAPTDARPPTAPPVTSAAGVRIEGAQAREGLPGVPDGVVYLTLTNTGRDAVALVRAATPIARAVTPMKDHGEHGRLDTVLEPGEKLVFSPGGQHLMLEGLTRPPKVGETLPVTLTFEPGGEVELDVPVNPY